jgi:flagellin-like protein
LARELLGSKRAVSPVVSSLLMIVITIAGSGLIWSSTSQWIRLQRINEMQVIRERLIIEDAWFTNGEGKNVTLTMTNIGRIDLMIRRVKVNEVTIVEIEDEELEIVGRGETVSRVIEDFDWGTITEYRVSLITVRGNRFEAVFVSP